MKPCYNLISIGMPYMGGAAAWGLAYSAPANAWHVGIDAWQIFAAVIVLVGSCVVGLGLGVAACVRRERWWGLSLLGLLLNAPLPAMMLGTGLVTLRNWLLYG